MKLVSLSVCMPHYSSFVVVYNSYLITALSSFCSIHHTHTYTQLSPSSAVAATIIINYYQCPPTDRAKCEAS
jgi:amino acid permease